MDFKKDIVSKIPVGLVLYYVFSFSVLAFCIKYFKSGPCTPNLDMFSFLIFNVISIGGILVCFYQLIRRNKEAIPKLILHITALLILYIVS